MYAGLEPTRRAFEAGAMAWQGSHHDAQKSTSSDVALLEMARETGSVESNGPALEQWWVASAAMALGRELCPGHAT
jgi:hypothetical protein